MTGGSGCLLSSQSGRPDPSVAITVENARDDPAEIDVTVGQRNETRREATYELDGGEEREVYNLDRLDPDGIETFDVTANVGEQRESVEATTNECFGDVVIGIDRDGELQTFYSIC